MIHTVVTITPELSGFGWEVLRRRQRGAFAIAKPWTVRARARTRHGHKFGAAYSEHRTRAEADTVARALRAAEFVPPVEAFALLNLSSLSSWPFARCAEADAALGKEK